MSGYHGSISGEPSVLSHTYNPWVILRVLPNRVECGEFRAAQVHPTEAREMIYSGAEAAVRRLGSVPLPKVELPARLDVELQTADMAHVASSVKGVERNGTRSARIHGEDPLEVYWSFIGITCITRVSKGR